MNVLESVLDYLDSSKDVAEVATVASSVKFEPVSPEEVITDIEKGLDKYDVGIEMTDKSGGFAAPKIEISANIDHHEVSKTIPLPDVKAGKVPLTEQQQRNVKEAMDLKQKEMMALTMIHLAHSLAGLLIVTIPFCAQFQMKVHMQKMKLAYKIMRIASGKGSIDNENCCDHDCRFIHCEVCTIAVLSVVPFAGSIVYHLWLLYRFKIFFISKRALEAAARRGSASNNWFCGK